MFEKQLNQWKEYFRSYIKQVPAEEVFIGTILFYVIFSLAFFMCDHSNIDLAANTIMFYNSWIIFCSIALYLLTANVFCCVIAVASLLASSLAELVLGTLYYPSRMFLSTYLHHILYSFVYICSIYFGFRSFSVAVIGSYIELSAIFQAIKRIWNVKSLAFDFVNAAVFFLTRIVLWIPMVATVYLFSETPGEKWLTYAVASFTGFHIFWSYTQIRNLIRRYFSSTNLDTDVAELYLTMT
jgi:hypothetical protein